jgi:hypothetical protein
LHRYWPSLSAPPVATWLTALLATTVSGGDMPQRITKCTVGQLSPANNDAQWDAEVKGFGVPCRPSGAKYYFLKMRVGGRQRWLTIGRHGSPWTPPDTALRPPWTPDTARREALRVLGLKAAGNNPAALRDRQKSAVTIAELADRFLREHVARHCKPRTVEEYQRAVEYFIKPGLGRHRITDLTRADISHFHQQHRDRPYQANRSLAVVSKMLNLAEAWELRTDGSNPCRHVKKHRENKRERYLTKEDLQRLGIAMDDAKQNQADSPFVFAAIGLLVLTGANLRRSVPSPVEAPD